MNHRKPTDRKNNEQKPTGSRPFGQKPTGQKPNPTEGSRGSQHSSASSLTKQEKELLEDCLDDLYEDYSTYRDSLKKDEEMNVTYKMFMSIVKKLGLRQPK